MQPGEDLSKLKHKALFEFHLSWKLVGIFGGHGGAKSQIYGAAVGTALLACSAGLRNLQSRCGGRCAHTEVLLLPSPGSPHLPRELQPLLSLNPFPWKGHSHTGDFHHTEQWRERSVLQLPGYEQYPGSPAFGSAEAIQQQQQMRLSLFCLPHPPLGKCRVCTLISDDTWGRQEMKQHSN